MMAMMLVMIDDGGVVPVRDPGSRHFAASFRSGGQTIDVVLPHNNGNRAIPRHDGRQ
jgi:hypothetical protein